MGFRVFAFVFFGGGRVLGEFYGAIPIVSVVIPFWGYLAEPLRQIGYSKIETAMEIVGRP